MRKTSLASLVFAALSPCVFASMLEPWGTKDLTKKSNSIAVGEVTSKWTSYDPERKMVYTYVKLKIAETLKGQKRSEVLIRVPGGQSKNLAMSVHGVASFRQGEKALVFLQQDRDGAPSLVGMSQGKYLVRVDSKTGKEMAYFRSQGVEYFKRVAKSSTLNHIEASDLNRTLPLQDLITEIKANVE